MTNYSINIENVRGLIEFKVSFDFSDNKIIVVTGKNGAGKTTLVKAFKLISDIQVFDKTSSLNSITLNSRVSFELDGYKPFSFSYNEKLKGLDTKEILPSKKEIISELPIPYGDRFQQFSLVAKYDSEIRTNIASSNYQEANELREFLNNVYHGSNRFSDIKVTKVKNNKFYFILRHDDYYIREDHFSSGEFFLIQLYRFITSGAKLVVIDELDISLDAAAQVHLIKAIKLVLEKYNSQLILISHSLAFMQTVDEGGLYYLEENNAQVSLEQRSFGYIKSDLYGFKGRDKYVITEDAMLANFLEFLIHLYQLPIFFRYQIIAVGGQPQIEAIAKKNDADEIFAPSKDVIIVIDKDIAETVTRNYEGETKIFTSPVNDIELFIWENRERLLPDFSDADFNYSPNAKKAAKKFWERIVGSKKSSPHQLYELVKNENEEETDKLADALKTHLCL
jgi:ABC-type dipeptide/oligopeptide/nickel transport system ATPase subunit